jgi:3-methyl-2-oxobutanoate hydroxymethyltransferase
MSFHTSGAQPVQKVTHLTLRDKKQRGEPITALTAYDYPTARLIDEAGIDVILVGDSVAMAVLGYGSTLPLTMDEMLHHAKAVRRGVRRSLLVIDMPYGSYHATDDEAVRNALRFIQEAGTEAVKLEGGAHRAALVDRLTRADIPVVGHIGLTPQSIYRMGGYRVQGKSLPAITQLMNDAVALEAAGAIALVLEGVPREVAARITSAAGIPTIGIGAGPECDGQILVFHDLAQLGFGAPAKFVRHFANTGDLLRAGLDEYRHAVETRTFPSDAESYHLSPQVRAELEESSLVTV